MISIWHLFWIIPSSWLFGMIILGVCYNASSNNDKDNEE